MVHTLAWMQSSAEPIGVKGRGSAHVACWWPLFWGCALLGIGAVILGCKLARRPEQKKLSKHKAFLACTLPLLPCAVLFFSSEEGAWE